MGYAGNYRYFTYASWVLSGASALLALVPFVYIWKILRDVLDAAMTAGHILLENGAEIFRVEETIDRICHHFGVQSENAFVLSNGIFSDVRR